MCNSSKAKQRLKLQEYPANDYHHYDCCKCEEISILMMIQSGPNAMCGDFSLNTSILPQLTTSYQFVFKERFVCYSSFHQIISTLSMNHIKLKQGLAKQKIRTSIVYKILKIFSKGKIVPHELVHKILLYLNYCCFDVSSYHVLAYSNIPRIRERLGTIISKINFEIGKQYLIQTENNSIQIFIEAQISRNDWFKKNNVGSLTEFFTPKLKETNFNGFNLLSINQLFSLQKEPIIRIRFRCQKLISFPLIVQYKMFQYATGNKIKGQQFFQAIQWVRNNNRLIFLPENIEIFWNQNQLTIKSSPKLMIWYKKTSKVSGVCWVKLNPLQILQIQGQFTQLISLAQYDQLTNI